MLKRFFLRERNMMIAIIINALIITLMYFPEFKGNKQLLIIDDFFILFFLLEAIVKLWVLKPRGYFASGWNVFDFAIVLFSLPTILSYFLPIPNTSLFLLLRLFRLIRLVKFMTFIPRMNQILSGLVRALKASVFVILALVFLNFMLALFTCHFYGEIAPEYFGDPLVSSYTIFQLFTVEGWNEIARVVIERTDSPLLLGLTRTYFVLVVLFGGIFGLSLANAIFVDEMTVDNNQDLEAKIDRLIEEIRQSRKSS